jgi:hypothetical protein
MTTKNKILIAVVALLVLIFFLDKLAFARHLYWEFWWMDIVMHLLAGFAIGLLALHFGFLLKDKGREGYPEKRLWLRV